MDHDRPKIRTWFGRVHDAFFGALRRFSWVAIALTSIVYASLLFLTGRVTVIDDYVNATLYQLGYAEDERSERIPLLKGRLASLEQAGSGTSDVLALRDEIARGEEARRIQSSLLVIKKDEKTSFLIGRNPGREELASTLRLLGQPRSEDIGGRAVLRMTVVDLQIGHLAIGRAGPSSSGLLTALFQNKLSAAGSGASVGFFRYTDSAHRLFPDFLKMPPVLKALGGGPGGAPAGVVSDKWLRFIERLAATTPHVALKVFPKPGVVVQISIDAVTSLGARHEIAPVGVLGIDMLLQGTKVVAEDGALATALEKAVPPVLLAAQLAEERSVEATSRVRYVTRGGSEEGVTATASIESRTWEILPDPVFLKNPQTRIGFVDVRSDSRAHVSRTPLFIRNKTTGALRPSFSLYIAVLALDHQSGKPGHAFETAMWAELARIEAQIRSRTYRGGFQLPDRFIPTDEKGDMELFFLGSTSPRAEHQPVFPSVSWYEAFDDAQLLFHRSRSATPPAELLPAQAHARICGRTQNFGGRVAFLGSFERSDFDFHPTPFTMRTPFSFQQQLLTGVEIHANAVANILGRRYLTPGDPGQALLRMMVATLILGFVLQRLRPLWGTATMLGILLALLAYAFQQYHQAQRVILLSPVLLSFPFCWALTLLDQYMRQRHQTTAISEMFRRFVAPDVVQMLIDDPNAVKPGGEKVELTLLFADLAGFTTMSGTLEPQKLVSVMNEYIGGMTEVIFEHRGTLDKYLGDGIMAYWNCPQRNADHALFACRCALAMQNKLAELQKSWTARGLPDMHMRIGVNTDVVVVGCLGSPRALMNFTCVGDGVVLAARLEGANKEFQTSAIIAESTWSPARDRITARFLDQIRVVGRQEPVRVYELIGEAGREPAWWSSIQPLYTEGMAHYQGRRWAEAIASFEKLLQFRPEDGPAKALLARCRVFLTEPPPEPWDGTYNLTRK